MSLFSDWPEICRQNVPLGPLTWFKLGGSAEYFAAPRSEEELSQLLRRASEAGVPVRILGLGANLLVADEGVRGLVIRLSEPAFAKTEMSGPTLTVGGGADMTKVVKSVVRSGLSGLEQLAGIPGTIGGGVSMNCGGKYGDLAQSLRNIRVMDMTGQIRELSRAHLSPGYRRCNLGDACVIDATFEMQEMDPKELDARFRQIWDYKQATQPPLGANSAGCIFRNPPGTSAGLLIDQAGLKGHRLGSAVVSEKHANFILANMNARAHDVLQLIELVQRHVFEHCGIMLEPEVKIWTDNTDRPLRTDAPVKKNLAHAKVA